METWRPAELKTRRDEEKKNCIQEDKENSRTGKIKKTIPNNERDRRSEPKPMRIRLKRLPQRKTFANIKFCLVS